MKIRYRGGKELFRIKVPSLPYDPTNLQKNRLGVPPLRTLIGDGDSKGVAGGVTVIVRTKLTGSNKTLKEVREMIFKLPCTAKIQAHSPLG